MALRSNKILINKAAIKDYLGGVSDYTFEQYISAGMPARYDNGRGWLAHTENIDEFFKSYTRVTMKNSKERR